MADVNANIGVRIDTSDALAQLKALQRQISQFHSSIARSSESAALSQRSLQKNLIGSINAIGAFSAELRTVRTSAETFTNSLEKNKFSMREYFRYAGASTKTFGKLFKTEFETIGRVAEERVKTLQTQYIKMGRNASGAMEAIAVRPTSLNMQDYGTRTAIAAQKQALFNQLMNQGTTNLLNFGKNTQWAGRQLMVGFTIPLSILGSTATKTFMEMEAQTLKFRKVYGDLFTPKAETQAALDSVIELGRQFTKYGISVSQTVALSAEAAAAGFQGLDLQRQTTEATRLSVLGQVDSQKALETTISLQNAFGMSSEKLADSINFLNAVENQTVVSLDDITTAIPKVAPVIQQLGGDVKDLTFFIAAMKEGGINASEGANALKSGLAALINPTKKASDMLAGFGINATAIIEKNKGDLKTTVIEFATALNQLDPLARARAIEQMFGKFQFARLSTLFANVARDGNQAARVLDLANSSVEELSALSEQELGMTADSAMNKFKKSVEDLKLALIPVGKAFLEAATPVVEFVGNVLEKFGNLSDGTKKLITFLTVGVGAIGPIFLMTFGLIANALANGLKGVMILRHGYLRLTGQSQVLGEQTQYLNTEQLEAAAAAHSLDQSHARLTQSFTAETAALQKLIAAYQSGTRAAQSFAFNNPGMMLPPRGAVKKLASGIVSVPGPKGAGDIVPAMLAPGESVIPADMTQKYGALIQGMIADNIPGYEKGRTGTQGTNVRIPGGFAAAHFGGSSSMTGTALLDMLEGRTDKVAESLRLMVKSMENADGPLTVFTNEVVAMSAELNEALGKTGSGKKASAQLARKELTTGTSSQVRDIELQRQLEKAGVSVEEIKNINEKLTGEIAVGFEKLGNITEITAEDVDDLISTAYKKVAETDKKVDAALSKMKEVTTVTDPNLLTRRPITKESYKEFRRNKKSTGTSPYYEGMEKMVGAGNVPFSKEAAFRITNPMAEGLGMSSAEAKIIYDKFSNETKITLSKLRGDLNAFTKEFTIEAAKIGEKVGTAAVNATATAAGTASPSRKTRKTGEDIGRGLEEGMKSRQDDVALVGSQLGNAATGGVKGGVGPIPFRAPGQPGFVSGNAPSASLGDIAARARINRENLINLQRKKESQLLTESSQKLNNLNSKIMSGTFALTSFAGIASMASGNLGKLSGIVFQLSGVMFALSTVLQILPGRFKTFLAPFLRIGPLLLFTAALAAGAGIIKLINNAREKERLAIEGVGKAANLTSDQIEKLAGVLGFTPAKSNLELSKPAVSGLTVEKSKQVEETRKLLAEDKDFKDQISVLKNATSQQADIIFKSLALRLTGQGATKEQITNYIYALQQEAGKTDVKFDLKSIDLSTKEGQAGLQNSVDVLLKDYKTAFDKGYKKTKIFVGGGKGGGILKETEVLSNELKTNLSTTANVIANAFMSLDTQLRSGIINADQFDESFNNISDSINKMPKAEGLFLMGELLKTLPSELAKSAAGLKNTADQLLIIKAAALGVAVTAEMIQALTIADTDKSADAQIRASAVRSDLENAMKKAKKVIAELLKGTATGTGKVDQRAETDKRLSVISNFFNAQEALLRQNRKSGEDAAQAFIDQSEAKVKAIEKEIDAQQLLVDANQRSVDLLNRRIELEYDRPIQKLQDESTILNNNLEIIRKQEDAINDQYDKQIQALEKISSANQEIANQEKSRLNIASALTSGDIAAAASAVQEARAQAAASQLDRQRTGIEASRQQAISGISVAGMTKDQIEARTYQIGQQTFLLEQQRKTLQNEITTLQDKNYTLEQGIYSIKQTSLIVAQGQVDKAKLALDEYNKTTDSLVNGITYLGKTQTEWDNVKVRVDAANSAIDLVNLELTKASTITSQIFKNWDAIKNKTITITTNYVTGTTSAPLLNPTTPTNSPLATSTYNPLSNMRARMYGGKIFPMNMGGMVPKYMAAGGGIGSDTVPAMLTPGEFVVNRQATKSFGPLLSMLNESKYPSMIGPSYGTSGGSSRNISIKDNSTDVYNYNVGINVGGTNVSADKIAKTVMNEIKYLDAQRVRGQRVS